MLDREENAFVCASRSANFSSPAAAAVYIF